MAGKGPRPKDPGRRARSNSPGVAPTILRFEGATQPPLPRAPAGLSWPAATRRWWAMWAGSPQAEVFGSTDWDFLLDTALLHASVWRGDLRAMGELRLRVAKFGATPEDRARLRFQFAEADSADAARPAVVSAAARYGPLAAVPDVACE